MNPVAAGLVTGALVVVGNWAEGKTPTINHAIGVAGVSISLALMDQANEKLATAFAWLIVLTVSFVYFPKIVKAAGLSGTGKGLIK